MESNIYKAPENWLHYWFIQWNGKYHSMKMLGGFAQCLN